MIHNASLITRLGMRLPVIQGPFGGGLSTVELAAAVSNAGGMGSYGAHLLSPDEIIHTTQALRSLTAGPFVMNLWVNTEDARSRHADAAVFESAAAELQSLYQRRGVAAPVFDPPAPIDFELQAEAILRARPPVFSFVFGVPSAAILAACRAQGIVTMGAATSLDEALALEAAGVEVVIATGFEAGGHRPSFLRSAEDSLHGTLALVRQVVEGVKVPVVAAGGIADAKGVAAALVLGAAAAQVGTAYLACDESGASALHRRRLFHPSARHTRLSDRVSGRLARFIATPTLDELAQFENRLGYPLQSRLTRPLQGIEEGLFYAGQGAPLLKHNKAAALTAALGAAIGRSPESGER